MVWYNIGVVYSQSVVEKHKQSLIDQGLSQYDFNSNGVKLTSQFSDFGEIELEIVKGISKTDFGSEIDWLIIVSINSDDNSCECEVYSVSDSELNCVSSESSENRTNWDGFTKEGMTINAIAPSFE